LSQGPHEQEEFYLTLASIFRAKNWIAYGQLDFEMVSRNAEKMERRFNFHELLNEELCCEKRPPTFEDYNLVDFFELRAITC
jgi:hypothetical protein